MNLPKDLIEAYDRYKLTGQENIVINKKNISIAPDCWKFSIKSLKNEVVDYLTKEGFECYDTNKYLGPYPILNLYGVCFKLEMRTCGSPVALFPVQLAILTPIEKN